MTKAGPGKPIVSEAAIREVREVRLARERERRGDCVCPSCGVKLIVEGKDVRLTRPE